MSDEMNRCPNEVERLITENFEEVQMDATYRLAMQQQTSQIIAGRSRKRFVWRILALPAAIAAVVAVIYLFNIGGIIHPGVNKINEPVNSIVKDQSSVIGPVTKPENSNKQMSQLPKPPQNGLAGISTGVGAVKQTVKQKQSSPGTTPAKSEPKKVASREPLVVVTTLHSPVIDGNGKALSAGTRLASGAIIRTGKGGRVTLVTRKGAELCLDSNSESSVQSGGVVALLKGRLYVSNHAKEIARIDTAAGKIKLLGTVVDTAVLKKDAVAVTVVEGKVQLVNSRGKSTVDAGKRSVMMASLAPESGKPVNTLAETAWYEGRRDIVSDFGDVAYIVATNDQSLASEVWVMNTDGSSKRRIKSYLGWLFTAGPWLPGQQMLQLDSHSVVWTTPDLKERRGHANGGHPVTDQRSWLLNAATGHDMPFEIPQGYHWINTSISPDSTKMAFCGWYLRDPDNREDVECGVWVYSIDTGEMRKVLDGRIKTPITWSPDSRMLAISTGEGYDTNHPLAVIDTITGGIKKLNVQGTGACFSPDGTKLAYCGEFTKGGAWYHGVPKSGSIWIKDLTNDAEPLRISPSGEGALDPHWSPDGSRVVYDLRHWEWPEGGQRKNSFEIIVAQADGSGCRKIYEAERQLDDISWSESGKALYVSTEDALLVVDPDGSGVKSEISYTEGSVLSPEEKAQTEAALVDIREAFFQYALGKVKNYEGDVAGTVECFRKSSTLLTELVWKYPLSGFGVDDTTAYADKATEQAARPAAAILSESCKERMLYLSLLFGNFITENKRMPTSIADISGYTPSTGQMFNWASILHKGGHTPNKGWRFNWLSSDDKKHVETIFSCPVGPKGYGYKAPAASAVPPKVGDVLFPCPNHPENSILWDEGKQQTWDSAMKR